MGFHDILSSLTSTLDFFHDNKALFMGQQKSMLIKFGFLMKNAFWYTSVLN